MLSSKNEVKSHGEKFNFDIFEFRKLKNSPDKKSDNFQDVADSAADEEFEEVNINDYLESLLCDSDVYNDADNVDQNSRDLGLKNKTSPTPEKRKFYKERYERERKSLVRVYLSPELIEYAENFGKDKRKNAGAGSGVAKILKSFLSLKKRSDLQVRRVQLLLVQLDQEENNLAVAQMKGKPEDELSLLKERLSALSKDVVFYIDLFGFGFSEIKEELPEYLRPVLKGALDRVTNEKREKRLSEYYAN